MTLARNLLTAYDETLLAMAEIEGYGWLSVELDPKHPWSERDSVRSALKGLQHHRDANEKAKREGRDWAVLPETESVEEIYGAGGWNRWIVLLNGDVMLFGMHAPQEMRERAKALGFRIFGGLSQS